MDLKRSPATRLRALLTECHPYELPLELGSQWLYRWLEDRVLAVNHSRFRVNLTSRRDILLTALMRPRRFSECAEAGDIPKFASATHPRVISLEAKDFSSSWKAPATFSVRRDRLRTRALDLLAIGAQISIAFIYAKYRDSIIYYGSRSRSSLRYPMRVNSHAKHLNTKFRNIRDSQKSFIETNTASFGTYNSFFVYDHFAFGGQFYDSSKWHALEAHWKYLKRIDISNCFKSIYTHSFAWSTGNDAHSKAHLNSSDFDEMDLGRAFDKVMQTANWGETHGICIGPEASRIFAEFIFQKIDLEIQERIRVTGLSHRDYEILRYVDDYFIYTMEEQEQETVASIIETVLLEYGFATNAGKTQNFITPFTTDISIRKANLKLFLRNALNVNGSLPDFGAREVSVLLKDALIGADNNTAAIGSSLTQIERQLKNFLLKRSASCVTLDDARDLMSYAWIFVHSMIHQYLSHPSVTSAMKVVRILRFYWLMPYEYGRVSHKTRKELQYRVHEALRYAISRALDRLIDVDQSEVEICHFLSLASACGIELKATQSLFDRILNKISEGRKRILTSKSDQSSLFLLLSYCKYFLRKGHITSNSRKKVFKALGDFSELLFSNTYVSNSRIRRHASQEVFLIAIMECPLISESEKYVLLNKPWIIELIKNELNLINSSPDASRRFLRKCIREVSTEGASIHIFAWDNDHFDDILYEKEPQFVY